MAPDLFRLKLVLGLLVVGAVFLLGYAVQRFYYYLKTRRVESIDTIRFHVFPDGVVALGGIVLSVFVYGGLRTLDATREFSTMTANQALFELDISSMNRGEIQLARYSAFDADTPFARPAAVYYVPGESFEVVVEVVEFRFFLSMLGQPGLARAVTIRGIDHHQGSAQRRSNEIRLGSKSEDSALSSLFYADRREIVLAAPPTLGSNDTVSLLADRNGALALVKRERLR